MNRWDKIKLHFTRNWSSPGKQRLARRLIPTRVNNKSYFEGISWMENESICIHVDSNSYIEWEVLSNGEFEKEINHLFANSLSWGGVALDVGANIGIQTIRMAKLVGDTGRVISCEPMPHLRKRLVNNLALNKIRNVTLVPVALSNSKGAMEVNIDAGDWNQGAFTLARNEQPNATIDVTTGDQLLTDLAISRLDLIKIDVEGFELPVLKGLEATITRFLPRIVFEYDASYWKRSNSTFLECYIYLSRFGYDMYEVFEFGARILNQDSSHISANIYCLPKSRE